MKSLKEKNQTNEKTKTAPPAAGVQKSVRAVDESTEKFWKESVQLLASKAYPNIEAAVDALVDEVGKKMGKPQDGQAEFLRTLFLNDPSLLEALRRQLKIG
jgi:hypothetical protein